ncbi:unnamed protein product [Protopolystoma xenopodis]|uniref:U3 small nucleolar RNA-associated protein 20 N-terminal domain-containing protein n=1 Tax=Protopolystoma xenopodis TaxID=117903 RepID=A0A3S5FEK4_9PLAT|nr:unnamed protein product [Protopolystoma xenopodis]
MNEETHRSEIAPLLIRVLFGRLQLANGQHANAILSNLAICTDSELDILLELLISPLLPSASGCKIIPTDHALDLSDFISQLRVDVKNAKQIALFLPHNQLTTKSIPASLGFGDTLLSWSRLHA